MQRQACVSLHFAYSIDSSIYSFYTVVVMEHPALELLLEEKIPIVVWVSLTTRKFQVNLERFSILNWN